MSLEELIRKRQNLLQVQNENNFDWGSIIAGLYSKKSHFIYELIQNAEDENATAVNFYLYKDKLVFEHNSKNYFTIEDIVSITSVGNSTKKGEENTIGKFGIGFKSVFNITDRPEIHSGEYHFAIESFIVPSILSTNKIVKKTIIVLPFKITEEESIYTQIKDELEKIDIATILFLTNIKHIEYEIENKLEIFSKKTTPKGNGNLITFDAIKDNQCFLKFDKDINIDKKNIRLSVAFKYKDDKLVEVEKSNLFVFFETEKESNLKFLVHAPFITTPARDNINDDAKNKFIQNELVNFVAELIDEFRLLNFWNKNTIDIFPVENKYDNDEFYEPFYQKMKSEFQNKQIIPTSKNDFSFANDIIIGIKALVNLLDDSQTSLLFRKSNWSSEDLTNDTKTLLKSIGIKEISVNEFAKQINKEFLENQHDEWFVSFYAFLSEHKQLWQKREKDYFGNWKQEGVLISKPIIRTNKNEHIQAFNNTVPNVWLSQTEQDNNAVKYYICKNENAKKFLIDLGLDYPDDYASIVNDLLPKYSNDVQISQDVYWEDFDFIFNKIDFLLNEKKNNVFSQIRNIRFILTNDNSYNKPNQCYQITDDLENFFESVPGVLFVSDKYYEKYDKEKICDFFNKIEINQNTKRIPIILDVSKRFELGIKVEVTHSKSLIDYSLDGLDSFLSIPTIEKSIALWNFLLFKCSEYNYFKGEFKYYRRVDKSEYFNASFYKKLLNSKWIYNQTETLCSPNEIRLDELYDSYNQSSNNIKTIESLFEFKKQTKEQQLEIELQKEKNNCELLKNELQKKDQEIVQLKLQFGIDEKIEEEIEQINICTIEEMLNKPRKEANYKTSSSKIVQTDDNEIKNRISFPKNKKDRTNLGNEGKAAEQIVYEHLEKKYKNDKSIIVKLMNDVEKNQTGYDIQVYDNAKNEIIEYVEVKSSNSKYTDTVTVSEAQYKLAKEQKEKFSLYCVFDIRNNPTIIPIGNFFDKIELDEVSISKLEIRVNI